MLLPIISLSINCSTGETDESSSSLSNHLLELGYENCLVCHIESGSAVNLSHHCLHFDPINYVRIPSIDYSPSLNDCLICHTSHSSEKKRTVYDCSWCHVG